MDSKSKNEAFMVIGFLDAIPLNFILKQLNKDIENYNLKHSKESFDRLESSIFSTMLKMHIERDGIEKVMENLEKGSFGHSLINSINGKN